MSSKEHQHTEREAQQSVSCYTPVKMVWKADSTFEASSAEVSMNDKPFSAVESMVSVVQGQAHGKEGLPAKLLASSVGTALRCFKSLLFPTSMMTMLPFLRRPVHRVSVRVRWTLQLIQLTSL